MQRENLPADREGRFNKYVDYSRSATIVHKAQKSLDRLGLRDSVEIVCSMAREVWTILGITPQFTPLPLLWDTLLPPGLPSDLWLSVALTIMWKIWDARNSQVFRGLNQHVTITVSRILEDFTLWANRCKTSVQKEHAELWRDFISSRLA